MTKEDKAVVLEDLKSKLEEYSFFYLTDPTAMTAAQTNRLRRKCFEENVEMIVVKNKIVGERIIISGKDRSGEHTAP